MLLESNNGSWYLAAAVSRDIHSPLTPHCGDGGIYVRTDSTVVAWLKSLGITVTVGP